MRKLSKKLIFCLQFKDDIKNVKAIFWSTMTIICWCDRRKVDPKYFFPNQQVPGAYTEKKTQKNVPKKSIRIFHVDFLEFSWINTICRHNYDQIFVYKLSSFLCVTMINLKSQIRKKKIEKTEKNCIWYDSSWK